MSAAEAARLHREAIIIDATCPLLDAEHLEWWIEGGATAAAPTLASSENAAYAMKRIGGWLRTIAADPRLVLVRSAADIERCKREGRFGIIFHLQGTMPIEDNLDLIGVYKALGVGIIQLAYNVRNRAGDGCEERNDAGLSNFGVDLVKRLNEERVIVDCSHTGYRTTMEAIALSTAPVVFSHANAKAVHPSPRNITDEQIKAVAATGGLVGTVGFPAFVSSQPQPTLDAFIDHIAYIADLVGIEHTGLGIDYFTGQAGVMDEAQAKKNYAGWIASRLWQPETYPPPPYYYPAGIEDPRGLPNLTARLLERGFSAADVRKVLGENWLRVYRAVWGA